MASSETARAYILFKALTNKAKRPSRKTEHSAGYDLYAAHEATVPANGSTLVGTDISVVFPTGHYGHLCTPSALAYKTSLFVNAGIVDADYTGEVLVLLTNPTGIDVAIRQHDRIAQLLIIPYLRTTQIQQDFQCSPDFDSVLATRERSGFGVQDTDQLSRKI